MTLTAIIQARLGSSRFPRKIISKIGDTPMLQYVIKQTLSSKYISKVVIATTTSKKDREIINFCKKIGVDYFRGSEKDVLDRYYRCAKKFCCDPVIRVSADCPFIDPHVINRVVSKFLKNEYDYVSNNIIKKGNRWINSLCRFPQGMVVEISSFDTLKIAWKEAKKPSEREHVYPYIQFNPRKFHLSNVINKNDLSFIRCTVDYEEDLIFVNEIWKRFSKNKKYITIDDIVKIVKEEPHLLQINKNLKFDEGYKNSIKEDKKAGFS